MCGGGEHNYTHGFSGPPRLSGGRAMALRRAYSQLLLLLTPIATGLPCP